MKIRYLRDYANHRRRAGDEVETQLGAAMQLIARGIATPADEPPAISGGIGEKQSGSPRDKQCRPASDK